MEPANPPASTCCRIREGVDSVSISERKKELKRRRHRKSKLGQMAHRLKKATVSEKAVIAEKVRKLTPGCEEILKNWGLEPR